MALSTGGGNLHFAPDRQWEKEGDKSSNNGKMTMFGGFLDLSSVIEMYNEGKTKKKERKDWFYCL